MRTMPLGACAAAALLFSCATAQEVKQDVKDAVTGRVSEGVGEVAVAELSNQSGERVGDVELRQAPNGVLARLKLTGIPQGEHAFHVHEVGQCEPPFKTAGGHYNPAKNQHGIDNPQGMHAGDLPNVHVPAGGALEVTLFLDGLSLRQASPLFDADGSSVVIHAGADDYRSDPAGNAGDRIACGVVKAR